MEAGLICTVVVAVGASMCGGGAKMKSGRGLRLDGAWLVRWEGLPRVEVGLKCTVGMTCV